MPHLPPLNAGQAKLVAGLRSTGPARWALRSTSNKNAWMLRGVMSAFMQEHLMFKLNHDAQESTKGLVVCPSANMHFWYAAGWDGPTVSSIQFMNSYAPPDKFDVVLFDVQQDYPAKFVERLDAFLEDPNAPVVAFWLPVVEGEPDWMAPLMAVLSKHRFVTLQVN